ncbi:MAG: AraC family transcriptional regulator [Lachnospiraceae bacterium]|nr:AraC family transcriptional regulator [Lachnospiraceae bacterium]
MATVSAFPVAPYSAPVAYDMEGIPLSIQEDALSYYPEFRMVCGWHEDLEVLLVEEGEMDFYVDGEAVALSEGDCLLIGPGKMHFGLSRDGSDCSFLSVLFHPSLITANRKIYSEFLQPALTDPAFACVRFPAETDAAAEITQQLEEILSMKEEEVYGYPLIAAGILSGLLMKHAVPAIDTDPVCAEVRARTPAVRTRVRSVQQMLSCIIQNYTEEPSLDEIAESGAQSKSTCCRLFRAYLGQSPVDYLNAYRLQASCKLLAESSLKINDVAAQCGFNNTSYYIRMFQRSYGITPRDYRMQAWE